MKITVLNKEEIDFSKKVFRDIIERQYAGEKITSTESIEVLKKFIKAENIYIEKFKKEEFKIVVSLINLYLAINSIEFWNRQPEGSLQMMERISKKSNKYYNKLYGEFLYDKH